MTQLSIHLCFQQQAWCPIYNLCSINACWVNKWMNEWMVSDGHWESSYISFKTSTVFLSNRGSGWGTSSCPFFSLSLPLYRVNQHLQFFLPSDTLRVEHSWPPLPLAGGDHWAQPWNTNWWNEQGWPFFAVFYIRVYINGLFLTQSFQ